LIPVVGAERAAELAEVVSTGHVSRGVEIFPCESCYCRNSAVRSGIYEGPRCCGWLLS
jgi:hypothetical protein